MAALVVDNACEIAFRTYFSLPTRDRGGPVISLKTDPSFHQLLSAFERCFEEWPAGLIRGEVQWLHQLRNRLHHEGNGLTIDASKLDRYLTVVETLLRFLFSDEPVDSALAVAGTVPVHNDKPAHKPAMVRELDEMIARVDRRVEALDGRPVAVPAAEVVDLCERSDEVVQDWYCGLSGIEQAAAAEFLDESPFPSLDDLVLEDPSATQEYLFFQRLFLIAALS